MTRIAPDFCEAVIHDVAVDLTASGYKLGDELIFNGSVLAVTENVVH